MSDHEITLPPLPPAEWLGYDPERGDLHGHSFDVMREFARAAVLLDRQQRAAPTYGSIAERAAAGKDAGLWPAAPSAEPVAAALRFPGDARLCLSTVFDTVKEARDFADTRTSGAVVEPLCLCKPAPGAEPVKGAVWMDGSVSLVSAGSEDAFCRHRGAARLYLPPQPAPSAEP
jgi:hypothetical protein